MKIYKMVLHWGSGFAIAGGFAAWQLNNQESDEDAKERLERANPAALQQVRDNSKAIQDFMTKQKNHDKAQEENMMKVLYGGSGSEGGGGGHRGVRGDSTRGVQVGIDDDV